MSIFFSTSAAKLIVLNSWERISDLLSFLLLVPCFVTSSDLENIMQIIYIIVSYIYKRWYRNTYSQVENISLKYSILFQRESTLCIYTAVEFCKTSPASPKLLLYVVLNKE